MPKRKKPQVTPRKTPQQARSSDLVGAILRAAIRVLQRDGAAGFTTIKVAKQAGVSVGSLYQYFPNKESILFRLQADEWDITARLLNGILSDGERSAPERLRAATHAFFRTELEEAPLRRALGDAAPLYREAEPARAHRERGLPVLSRVLAEAAPQLSAKRRAFAAELYITVLASVGERISETVQSALQLETWSDAVADMFLAYLRE